MDKTVAKTLIHLLTFAGLNPLMHGWMNLSMSYLCHYNPIIENHPDLLHTGLIHSSILLFSSQSPESPVFTSVPQSLVLLLKISFFPLTHHTCPDLSICRFTDFDTNTGFVL